MAKVEDCPGFETFGADVKAARGALVVGHAVAGAVVHPAVVIAVQGLAHQHNNNLPYEVSRPTSRRPLSMSYSPFRTSTEYIIVLFLEQCKERNVNYKLQPICI